MTIDQVEELEAARCRAMLAGDVEAFERLLSDDLRWTHASGGVDGKASMLRQYREGSMAVHSLDRSAEDVRIFGRTAVASGSVRMDASIGPVRKQVHSRYQAVWSEHDGTPRLVSLLSARAG